MKGLVFALCVFGGAVVASQVTTGGGPGPALVSPPSVAPPGLPACVALTTVAAEATPEVRDGGVPPPYTRDPTWKTDAMGLYETGLLLADLDRDGYPDLITASGNDQGLQPLAVYLFNPKTGTFPARPSWLSEDLDGNMNAAVGDLDGDGCLDVAVSTMAPPSGRGGVKVYFSRDCAKKTGCPLEKKPSYHSQDVYNSFACALGDANGDGRLDLATSDMAPSGGGSARIYFNLGPRDGGMPEPLPGWRSQPAVFGAGLLFSDVQQDGFLDLVLGAPQVMVFPGTPSRDGGVFLPRMPGWSSAPGALAPYVAAGPLGTRGQMGLVVSRNNLAGYLQGDAGTTPRYEVYFPGPDAGTAAWTSQAINYGGGVALADVNGDGVTDLVGGAWGEALPVGGPLQLYLGQGKAFLPEAAFTSRTVTIGQSVAAADLKQRFTCGAAYRVTVSSPQAVVTLPVPLVGAISQVLRGHRRLGSHEYTTLPGAPWISFARRLLPGEQVEISYTVPRSVDVLMANQNCDVGDFAFYSYENLPPCPTARDAGTVSPLP